MPVDRWPPLDPESSGELGPQTGVVQRRQRALVMFGHAGVERIPTAGAVLDFGDHHRMGVQVRVLGATGVLTEGRHRDPAGVDHPGLAVHRAPRVRLVLDEREHPCHGGVVGAGHLIAHGLVTERPQQ